MLQFIGTGSAFYPELGNNGAYIKKGNTLFMIDCGSSTFSKLKQNGQLEDIENVIVLMTHLHPDHAGSLGDLIFYGYYSMGEFGQPAVTVLAPDNLQVETFLRLQGVVPTFYQFVSVNTTLSFDSTDLNLSIEPVVVEHVPYIPSYGYVLSVDGESIYYSGDSNMIPSDIVERFKMGEFSRFYQDTCGAEYPGNVHLPQSLLEELIPRHLRDKVYCMHFDAQFSFERAADSGFNIATI